MHQVKNIIVGISGGIAAYKIPSLIRLFRKNNIDVQVVCTKHALEFVTPLTLETLSENKVYSDVFQDTGEYSTVHISITDRADAMIVAPATANILAKFARGIADDALSTTYLSFNRKVFIAPAMNTKMWDHPATRENIQILRNRGNIFIEPDFGFLACGYEGKGRMAEPEQIFSHIIETLRSEEFFAGKRVLVTAGPTHEPIDPVRFIGNRSSGKMGFALAEAFADAGAQVTLISGPVHIQAVHPGIETVFVQTAGEMLSACLQRFSQNDITLMAAAVADFTPEKTESSKIKKSKKNVSLKLNPTVDILKELGKKKKKTQILVGFALETENEIVNATQKLQNKNLDCIVLNSLNDPGSGFDFDTNKVTVISHNTSLEIPLKHKKLVAEDIVSFIKENLINK